MMRLYSSRKKVNISISHCLFKCFLFAVPFDFSKPPAIVLRGYSNRVSGLKNQTKWKTQLPKMRKKDLEKVKSYLDENMFQLSEILVSATDGHNKSIESQDYWIKDMGMGWDGLHNILNSSLYNMGTAETSIRMEINEEVKHDIWIYDPHFYYFTTIQVKKFRL